MTLLGNLFLTFWLLRLGHLLLQYAQERFWWKRFVLTVKIARSDLRVLYLQVNLLRLRTVNAILRAVLSGLSRGFGRWLVGLWIGVSTTFILVAAVGALAFMGTHGDLPSGGVLATPLAAFGALQIVIALIAYPPEKG